MPQAQELATTLLDALGILLVAAGIGAAFFALIGWSALAISGLVLLGCSWLLSWWHERSERSET
jgi:hypothetical protein